MRKVGLLVCCRSLERCPDLPQYRNDSQKVVQLRFKHLESEDILLRLLSKTIGKFCVMTLYGSLVAAKPGLAMEAKP